MIKFVKGKKVHYQGKEITMNTSMDGVIFYSYIEKGNQFNWFLDSEEKESDCLLNKLEMLSNA